MFQSNDASSTGFISGQQAKTLLLQSGLAQNVLVQVWNLSDCDKDGRLSFDEFILAMHLCDFAKAGNALPSTLPLELQPQRSRSASNLSQQSLEIAPQTTSSSADTSPTLKQKQATTFEDKRRENFDRGNAVLEAKRQALREQEEREKREREEKERLEQERKQKIREEQERRRLAEMERQMERQRLLDMQREEERRKAIEQREAARNELIRQQRIEWEKQKKQELEQQKLKLQEQLSTLKAKDKNLEYDMQMLNKKISSYKTKISDSQTTLKDLNTRLDVTRKSFHVKQSEVELAEKQLREYTQNLNKLSQEKFYLSEQQKNLNQDSPFAEEYRNDSMALKMKQTAIQQLKADLDKLETQINSTRTQLEIIKHEVEVGRADEADYTKENARLEKLLEIKKNNLPNGTLNITNHTSPLSWSNSAQYSNVQAETRTTTNNLINSNSINSISKFQVDNQAAISNGFKNSVSLNNIRSATPKDNYDAFKDEIMKIQQMIGLLSRVNNYCYYLLLTKRN